MPVSSNFTHLCRALHKANFLFIFQHYIWFLVCWLVQWVCVSWSGTPLTCPDQLFTVPVWVLYRDVINTSFDLPCQNFHLASLCNRTPIRRWNLRNLFRSSLSKIYQVLTCCLALSVKMSSSSKNLLLVGCRLLGRCLDFSLWYYQ